MKMFNKKVLKHNLAEMNPKELIKFIKHEFPINGQDYHTHARKVQIIKSLSPSELSSAIARMEGIKSQYDPSKTWGDWKFDFGNIVYRISSIIWCEYIKNY